MKSYIVSTVLHVELVRPVHGANTRRAARAVAASLALPSLCHTCTVAGSRAPQTWALGDGLQSADLRGLTIEGTPGAYVAVATARVGVSKRVVARSRAAAKVQAETLGHPSLCTHCTRAGRDREGLGWLADALNGAVKLHGITIEEIPHG